ncbi:hypothetical protein F5877DRAFT_73278, partial [Lentinula edodes]
MIRLSPNGNDSKGKLRNPMTATVKEFQDVFWYPAMQTPPPKNFIPEALSQSHAKGTTIRAALCMPWIGQDNKHSRLATFKTYTLRGNEHFHQIFGATPPDRPEETNERGCGPSPFRPPDQVFWHLLVRLIVGFKSGQIIAYDTTSVPIPGSNETSSLHVLQSSQQPILDTTSNTNDDDPNLSLLATIRADGMVQVLNANLESQGGWVPILLRCLVPKGQTTSDWYPRLRDTYLTRTLVSLDWLAPGHTFRTTYTAAEPCFSKTQNQHQLSTAQATFGSPSPLPLPSSHPANQPAQTFVFGSGSGNVIKSATGFGASGGLSSGSFGVSGNTGNNTTNSVSTSTGGAFSAQPTKTSAFASNSEQSRLGSGFGQPSFGQSSFGKPTTFIRPIATGGFSALSQSTTSFMSAGAASLSPDGFASFAGTLSTFASAASSGSRRGLTIRRSKSLKGPSRFGQSENKTPSPFGSQSPPGGAFSNFTSNGPSVFGKPAQTGASVFGRTKSESHSVFEQPSAGGAFGALNQLESASGSPSMPSSPDSDIVKPSVFPVRATTSGDLQTSSSYLKPASGFGAFVLSVELLCRSLQLEVQLNRLVIYWKSVLRTTDGDRTVQRRRKMIEETNEESISSTSSSYVEIPPPAKQLDGEEKVPDSDAELGDHLEQHGHHDDDDDEGDFLSESYDSHPGEGEEQSKEGESEEVEGKEYLDEPSPSSSPEPTGIPLLPLPPSRSRSNTPQAQTPRTEPNSPSPSTSEDSFFGGMTEKLDSGNPQPLFSPFPAASQPGGMLYVGTIPSEEYIPDASLGITSDGFFDLEEQPKRVAVVGARRRVQQPPLHKPGVWRNSPAAIPLLSRTIVDPAPSVVEAPTGPSISALEDALPGSEMEVDTQSA